MLNKDRKKIEKEDYVFDYSPESNPVKQIRGETQQAFHDLFVP